MTQTEYTKTQEKQGETYKDMSVHVWAKAKGFLSLVFCLLVSFLESMLSD